MIKLADLIKEEHIISLKSDNKKDALNEMIDIIHQDERLKDISGISEAIFDRENVLSTGIGLGLAVPHARMNSLDFFLIALARSTNGIEFDSIDGKPVNLIFMIVGPENPQKNYLQILATISKIARNTSLKQVIVASNSKDEIIDLLKEY